MRCVKMVGLTSLVVVLREVEVLDETVVPIFAVDEIMMSECRAVLMNSKNARL